MICKVVKSSFEDFCHDLVDYMEVSIMWSARSSANASKLHP